VTEHQLFFDEFQHRLGALSPLLRLCYRWFFGDAEAAYKRIIESGKPLFPAALETLSLKYNCAAEEIRNIPRQGPAILVSNHTYGIADGLILGAVVSGVRADMRFLAHYMAGLVPQARHLVIPINPFGDDDALRMNRRSLKESIRYLNSGGALIVFPAGRQASYNFSTWKVGEFPWTGTAAKLSKRTSAPVVPVFFHGRNSWKSYAGSAIHPLLGDALSGRDLIAKRGRTFRLSIGAPLDAQALVRERGIEAATEYLRDQTLALADRAVAIT
jgi:putative hemolysin